MEYSFFMIFLAIGVCGQNNDPSVIPVSSAEVPADNVSNVIPDQNEASDNINVNYYGDGIERRNDREGSKGNRFNYARYFGNDYEDILFDKKLSDNEKYERRRGNYRYFRYDYGNPDIHGKIERPCQGYDVYCIRRFFAEHSKCKISGRQVPDPLYRAQATINIPKTNMSVTLVNIDYKGIKDGRVEEFYIDKATDNLVIAIYFDAVSFATKNVNLKYYLRGREPVVTRDVGGASFLKFSVTLVIPNLKDLKLERADVFTFSGEPIPPFLAGPRLALSTDPEVVAMFAATVASVPIDDMESLFTEGIFYAANFIQYNICDFDLKLI